MKYLLLLLVGCSSLSEGGYKRKYHIEDFKSTMEPSVVHTMLAAKMKKCYPQSDYPVYEKTVAAFDVTKQVGTISYEIDNQSMGPTPLVLVEVLQEPTGSLIRVYSKGDLFRPATLYRHQIHKWLDGKKVDCHSHGEI